MLKSFYVNNYKCLVDVRLPLTPIHVIIGQNDSGKTSLLEAIFALVRSTDRPLAEAFLGDWQDQELVFAGADKPVIGFEVRFGSASGEAPAPVSYHLEVEFGKRQSCRAIDERADNGDTIRIQGTFTGLDWDFSAAGSESRPRARSVHRDRRADWEWESVSIRPQIDGNPRRD